MERIDGKKNEESMRIRMSTNLLTRIQAAREPAGWGEEAVSSFARHLLILGLEEEERIIAERQKRGDKSKQNLDQEMQVG